MRSALYLLSALPLWPLFVFALPLPWSLAHANTNPALQLRENIVEQATIESERYVRRDVDSAISMVGKERPKENPHDVRKLKERWFIGAEENLFSTLPGISTDGGTDSPPKKRWVIPSGSRDIPLVAAGESTDGDSVSAPKKR